MTDLEAQRANLNGSDVYKGSHSAYKSDIGQYDMAVYLNSVALNAFRDVFFLKYYSQMSSEDRELTRWFDNGHFGQMPSSPYNTQWLSDKVYLDYMLLGCGIELHFKACLITKGYLVQIIRKSVPFRELSNKQAQEPIPKQDLFAIETYQYEGARGNILRGLSDSSLKFSTLLKDSYSSQLDKSDQILNIAEYCRHIRNEIHLPGDAFDAKPLDEYTSKHLAKIVIDFINNDVVECTNNLIETYSLPYRQLIPIGK